MDLDRITRDTKEDYLKGYEDGWSDVLVRLEKHYEDVLPDDLAEWIVNSRLALMAAHAKGQKD